MSVSEKRICIAQIGAAHGIQGHVRVKPFTEAPENVGEYGKLQTENGERSFKIASLRPIKGGMLVIKFKGVNDRNEAETLNGTKLFIDRDRLPDLDDDDDFYVDDLIGLRVIDENEELFGKILAIQNFGAGDLVEIKPGRGPSVLIPFTKTAVPDIFINDGYVVIDREEAGVLADDADVQKDRQQSENSR